MKKTYIDFRILVGIVCFGVFVITIPAVFGYFAWLEWIEDPVMNAERVAFIFMIPLSSVIWFLVGDKLLPFLTVKEDKVIWRCFLFPTVKMKLEDCLYVGIADYSDVNRSVFSGAEITYIYLSTKPLPPKHRHNINSTRCKKGFIKFAYSDKLCLHLAKVLPEKQARIMSGYYSYMHRPTHNQTRKKK